MRRMWQIYVGAWLLNVVISELAAQVDAMEAGYFGLTRGWIPLASAIPAALLLALVWPLSGYLERIGASTRKVMLVHVAGAFGFALWWHVWDHEFLRWVQDGLRRSFYWYIWPFFYSMMMYGLAAGVFHSIRSGQAQREQALVASQAQTLLMTAELAALRNKLNPHFLFNKLHSIIALVRKDALAAEAALFRFSDMLRYLLETEKSGNDRVMLEDELGFVRDYLALEALRLGPRLQVEWNTDPQTLYLTVPALSVQPLVENSIKHAFNPRSRSGKLRIASQLEEGGTQLIITISDDGPGCDPASIEQASGMGVKTVQRRLQLAYQGQAGLTIHTAPGQGFSICLHLPNQAILV